MTLPAKEEEIFRTFIKVCLVARGIASGNDFGFMKKCAESGLASLAETTLAAFRNATRSFDDHTCVQLG